MKWLFLIALVVILLGSVELSALWYQFIFESVGPSGWLAIDVQWEPDGPWVMHYRYWDSINPPNYINEIIHTGPYVTIWAVRVRTVAHSYARGTFFEERHPLLMQPNYFFIDINPPQQDPTPPNPTSIGG